MKELFRRFNIGVDQDKAVSIYRNKIENILNSGDLGEKIFQDSQLHTLWCMCNELGIAYYHTSFTSNQVSHIFPSSLSFSEYLLRLQALLDFLWNSGHHDLAAQLAQIVDSAIHSSPTDLGIRIKIYQKKAPQLHFSGSKLLDKKLVDDVLGILYTSDRTAIAIAFSKGLKEFLEAKSSSVKLRNAIRDMQLACDEAVKAKFQDKNLGLRHLFKEGRWSQIGLNDYQKQIFWNLNEYIDKLVKHKSDTTISFGDAESVIYLTGLFIRLIFKDEL
jgi:hypothetical protein